jgi:hypothetical protein
MEYQEVSLTTLMVVGVVAVVMDEDEVDVIVVAVVASVVVTGSKTLAAMKRVQVTKCRTNLVKYVHLYLSCMNMTKYVNRNELLYCIQLIHIDIGFCRSWPREK